MRVLRTALYTLGTSARWAASASDLMAHCRAHRATSDPQLRSDLEVSAWKRCSSFSPSDVESSSFNDTVALMHTFSYFERWWNRGVDGPCDQQLRQARPLTSSVLDTLSESSVAFSKRDSFVQQEQQTRPRSSPLDEIIE